MALSITENNSLVLHLCRFLNPDKAALEGLMGSSPGWAYVLGQLLYNRMGAVAYGVLEKTGLLGKTGREFRGALKTAYEDGYRRSVSYRQSLEMVGGLLEAASFPYAALKGAYLCGAYPAGMRTSNDIDLLVNQADVSAAEGMLKPAGFLQGSVRNGDFVRASRADVLDSRINRGETVPFIKRVRLPGMEYLEVDVNFSLDYQARHGASSVATLLKGTQPLIIAGRSFLYTLPHSDFLLHLCCHLYKEATTYAWVVMDRDLSLYKFADIYLLLNEWKNECVLKELVVRAYELGVCKAAYYSLLHTKELFGIDDPALELMLEAISPHDKGFLREVHRPEGNRTYRYDERFTDWLFLGGRCSRLYEINAVNNDRGDGQ